MPFLESLFSTVAWDRILTKGLHVLLVLLLACVLVRVVRVAMGRMERTLVRGEELTDRSQRVRTLVKLLEQALVVAVWGVSLVAVLSNLGVDIGPILASAGVVGLAVGFGAQNLVRDLIAGLFIIMEDQVAVGDVAVVNGTGGLVEQINLRTLVLRDLHGTVHVFPNGTITTLANMTREWSAFVFDVGVAYHEDVDRVMAIMRRVARGLQEDPGWASKLLDDIEIFGLDRFDESALVIKGRWKTRPLKQWEVGEVGREFRRRLKKAFDEEGVEIPYPHRTLIVKGGGLPFGESLPSGRR